MPENAQLEPATMPDALAPKWASIDNAARYFDISSRTVQRLIQRGVIPARSFPGVRARLVDVAGAELVLAASR